MARIRLLGEPVSEETVRVLEKLLEDARKGRVRGVAFVALGGGKHYYADAVGIARDDPIRARGSLSALRAALEQIELRRSK